MRKAILLLFVFVIATLTVTAQDKVNVFSKLYPNQISAGVGFGSGISNFEQEIPQFFLNYERLVVDLGKYGGFGAGAHFSYAENRYKLMVSDKWLLKEATAGLRAVYHYTLISNLELYAGAMCVYRKNNFSGDGIAPSEKDKLTKNREKFDFSASAGARYFFSNNIGLFVGTGDGVRLSGGATFKF